MEAASSHRKFRLFRTIGGLGKGCQKQGFQLFFLLAAALVFATASPFRITASLAKSTLQCLNPGLAAAVK